MKRYHYPIETSPAITRRSGSTVVLHDWEYVKVDDYRLTVPAGFETDGASVPRIFFPLISAWDLSFSAPIVHDYLYRTQGRPLTVYPSARAFTRRETDRIFRYLQEDEGVWWWRRWSSWFAVRLFGFLAWHR